MVTDDQIDVRESNPFITPPDTFIPFHSTPSTLSDIDFPKKNTEKLRLLSIPARFLSKISGRPRIREKQYLVKLVVLGAAKTGKSSCISRYIADSFQGIGFEFFIPLLLNL